MNKQFDNYTPLIIHNKSVVHPSEESKEAKSEEKKDVLILNKQTVSISIETSQDLDYILYLLNQYRTRSFSTYSLKLSLKDL